MTRQTDFERDVYGVLGIPIDGTDMAMALRKIEAAAADRTPFLISTANLNFLANSHSDAEFRQSLLLSDLCTADGMPIVWIARLLGVPIKARVAGSDLYDALKSAYDSNRPLKVFLFGGPKDTAATACNVLNAEARGMTCVGSFYPGFCSVDDMSTDAVLDQINSSKADVLITALGAKKGQTWLQRNHDRLLPPVRTHLGAVINFQAGIFKRAPAFMQKWGLEWLWRIKEEPQLWRRYWHDGIVLLQLLLTRVLPLVILTNWHRIRCRHRIRDLRIDRTEDHICVKLNINGTATAKTIGIALPHFQEAAAAAKDVVINFADTCLIDARFIGLILMLDKILKREKLHLKITGIPPRIERLLRLNGFGFLLRA